MRVALFPSDADGCGRYRMIYPAHAAQAQTDDLQVGLCVLREKAGRIVGMPDVDVAVFQRPADLRVVQAIPSYQRRGIAVVVDLDDDLGALDPLHPVFPDLHPRNAKTNWHHLKQACRLADLVTVSTPQLGERYAPGRSVVLPNRVPASVLDITAVRDGRTVGWGGSTRSHVNDLTVTAGGVAQAIADTDTRFLLVGGDQADAQRQLALRTPPETTGMLAFEEYLPALAQLDVGIVPLRDSLFNRGKSALKGLEYAALGVPFVASPTPEYELLANSGVGVLATRGRDWRRQVRQLLSDAPLREELAERGRQVVSAEHLYETNGWRWAEAWEEAIRLRHAAHRKRVA